MVASKCDPLSKLDKEVETKLAYWFKHPNRGIVPISRDGVKAMSASLEATAAAAVSQREPSPEIQIIGSSTGDGEGRRAGTLPSASGSQPVVNFRTPSKERPAYLIKWSRFEEQLSNAFAELFCSEHFADVTLACDGGDVLKAHKIILAMSSPFFRQIFIDTPCKHPIVVLKEFSATVMRNILQYLYLGKVVLNENEISSFMDAADFFGICGVIPDHYSCDIFATTIPEPDQRQNSDKESQSETEVKLSEGSRTSENEESNEGRESQDEERMIVSQSPVIKYHGIKARWTRRYSNTSVPGLQNSTSPTIKEHKRSASAGEVESVPRLTESMPATEADSDKSTRIAEESLSQPLHDVEMSSAGEDERFEERPSRLGQAEDRHQRRIIQRAHPKDYSNAIVNLEDSSEASFDEWKNQVQHQTTYVPPSVSTASTHRTIRPTPYMLSAKDFSHPLQVSVETPKQTPMYGVPSTSTSSTGALDPARSRPHSGFPMYTSPHPLQSQMRNMHRPESETEFPPTTSTMPHLTSQGSSDERPQMRFRQLSSGSSTTTSPTAYGQDYPPRTHFSLLSAQGWPFHESHHRHRHHHHLEENVRDTIERRFRSDSLDRNLSHFANTGHLRGITSKPHSYQTPTDLSIPTSQHYDRINMGFGIPQLRSPSSSSTGTSSTRPKTKAIRSSQVPQSSRYTAAEVDQMVDAVANYPGNIVPCTLCQKFVKRERLRAHIHECHLLTGEKIICPHCGIALKSKGSFRVHIWRHKRGALPISRNTMSDFEGGRPPSSTHPSGPASH